MTKFGAKLLTFTIKNPQKRKFMYRFLTDYWFANNTLNKENAMEKILHIAHNYLHWNKQNLVIVELGGGLGNQLYGYAFGKMLESKGYSVIFNAGHYKNLSNGGGNRKILARILTPKTQKIPLHPQIFAI